MAKLTSIEETPFSNPVSHDGKGNISKAVKDNNNTEPNFPTVNVVFVKVTIKPANGKIVCCGHYPSRTNGIVCSNIRDYGDLTCKTDVAK